LVAGQVQVTDALGDITVSGWDLFSGTVNSFAGTLVEQLFSFSPGTDSLDFVPRGPGIYNLTHASIGSIGTPQLHSADYTFTLTVRPGAVAESGTLTLTFLALCLVSLSVARRSQAQQLRSAEFPYAAPLAPPHQPLRSIQRLAHSAPACSASAGVTL
jgi:hypothetical protein